MRYLRRLTLAGSVAAYLEKKQKEVDDGKPPRKVWDYARKTLSMQKVEATLKRMTGARGRCMYCEDSRGADIDHFWPMSRYRNKTFFWPNLLWVCSDCNRHKLGKFKLDDTGAPLLIDPTAVDPWDFLFYDTATGNITARFDAKLGAEDRRGRETLECLPALGDEAVVEGRARTYRNLKKAVKVFLERSRRERSAARAELLESIRDNDGFGLATWYFHRDGRDEPPFEELRRIHRDIWDEIEAMLRTG